MLARLQAQGKTVLIASHLLSQLEKACDRVAVLVDGQLVRIEPMRTNTLARDDGSRLQWVYREAVMQVRGGDERSK